MDPLILRKKIEAGHPIIAAAMATPAPFLIEMISQIEGYDALLLDFQHGLATEADLIPSFQAMRAGGGVAFPRVGWNDPHQISRILDGGALGIICPMINTREDVERFVGAARFPPLGYRSFGPFVAGTVFDDYPAKANDAVITLAMIETRSALENLDEILTVPGLDGVFIGQCDLGISLGHGIKPNWLDGEVYEATLRIRDAALAAGKVPGIMASTTAIARQLLDEGFLFIGAPSEGLLFPAMEAALAEIRGKD